MKKYLSLTLVLLLFNSVFSQIGINTETPTEILDIDGKVRIRNTEELTSSTIFALFVDENGVVGRTNINPSSPLTTFVNATSTSNVVSDFNAGNIIELPINAASIGLNTLNASVANNRIRIPEEGTYQLSASLNIALATGTLGNSVFLAFNVQLSKDNGSTWTAISGARPIFTMANAGRINYNSVLPTGIIDLDEGDLIRLVIYRTRGSGNLQGSNITIGDVLSAPEHGTKSFTLSLSKF